MSQKAQAVKGTDDVFAQSWWLHRRIEDAALKWAEWYRFQPLQTPIFEHSWVFHRGLGESSDMVSKETYSLKDRGGEELTLRPEGTAGVVRAFISNGWSQFLPVRYVYMGPMFRYEKPQKGRSRQFHQIGVEVLGVESPWVDVEVISMAFQFLKDLGLESNFRLKINSLGDRESRVAHRAAFKEFLEPIKDQLSPDSQMRLEKNPLRIFDSKDPGDQNLIRNAPRLKDFLNSDSVQFFSEVQRGLSELGISFEVVPTLVRGIDYYTHTVFEFETLDLGAQGAILSGGRYNGLVEELGGRNTPGIGWACGVERIKMLMELLQAQGGQGSRSSAVFMAENKPDACVFAMDEKFSMQALKMSDQLRREGFLVELLDPGSPGKRLKRVDKSQAAWALMLGEAEVQAQRIAAKKMSTGEQFVVELSKVSELLRNS